MPKSSSTARPSSRIITFSGLTSRCTAPARCANASARAHPTMTRTASAAPSVPSIMRSRSVRPETSSMAMNAPPSSVSPTSYTWTMPECASFAAARASRTRRSRALPSPTVRAASSLSATSRSSFVSRARTTCPMPPSPRAVTTS
jgi:hypothetical protein